MWYREHIGRQPRPVVDTWWQTETGAIMISPLPGVTATKPGSAMRPLPGIAADVVDDTGAVGARRRRRLPGAARAVAEHAAHHLGRRPALHRHVLVPVPGHVLRRRRRQARRGRRPVAARPGRRRDAGVRPQHLHHRGRVGAGVATRRWPRRRWSARPTRPPARRSSRSSSCAAAVEPRRRRWSRSCATTSRKTLGPIAKPRQIMLVPELPKTRSGKIMRRLLRDVAENRSLGDVTTLQDSSVMDLISTGLQKSTTDDRGRRPYPYLAWRGFLSLRALRWSGGRNPWRSRPS